MRWNGHVLKRDDNGLRRELDFEEVGKENVGDRR